MVDNSNNNSVTVELLQKYDRPGPRYTSYPTAPVWSDKVTAGTYQKALKIASEKKDAPFAIYCHIPFCHTRCYYCGCNTCITKQQDKVTRYLGYMDNELTNVSKLLGKRRRVNQFHFGGGTPTYIGIDGLQKIVKQFDAVFEFTKDCEISIEVDPRTTSSEDIRLLRGMGFNRVSFGVQDFDPEVQNEIGRKQSIECVQELLSTAREVNYKGINFDLIYGLPSQTPVSFD
ncbi:MAG: radical SAM protein, partial [bacterium]